MFGGLANGNSGYNSFPEEHRSQYDLFGKFPVGYAINNINFCQNDAGLNTIAMDPVHPNHVSTGLKLSYEEDERNRSITSVNENYSIQFELDCQNKVLDHYAKVQEQNITKGVRELSKKHTAMLLNRLEQEVTKKLNEKDAEIATMNRRNMELGVRMKQAAMEVESWHYKAKYNESVVNALKNYLQQITSQKHVQGEEGYGDSEVDDAASCTNVNDSVELKCKGCNVKEVCVLLLPCRHLCLCKDCEVVVECCPVCKTRRTESVHVFMG